VNMARDSVNMRQPVNNRTGYNRGYNPNSGRSFNAPSRSYSANRSFNQLRYKGPLPDAANGIPAGWVTTAVTRGYNLNSGRSFNAPSRLIRRTDPLTSRTKSLLPDAAKHVFG
jgi:hypothetical protein